MRYRIKTECPWFYRYNAAKQRCTNPNSYMYYRYGARGIKFTIDFWDMGKLWEECGADKMKVASIDRIDNDGDYTYENCRFIEKSENTIRSNTGRKKSKEVKDKIRQSLLGKKHTEERKKNMSIAQRKRHEKV